MNTWHWWWAGACTTLLLYLPFPLSLSFDLSHNYPSLFSFSILCDSTYTLCGSLEQKATMVHLIRQSIGELRDTATTSGSNSPLPLPSPLHNPSPLAHPHNSHLCTYSPTHRHPLLPPSHSSPRHTRPRSNSQPHLQNPTPFTHPSPLAHSHHIPSFTDLSKH